MVTTGTAIGDREQRQQQLGELIHEWISVSMLTWAATLQIDMDHPFSNPLNVFYDQFAQHVDRLAGAYARDERAGILDQGTMRRRVAANTVEALNRALLATVGHEHAPQEANEDYHQELRRYYQQRFDEGKRVEAVWCLICGTENCLVVPASDWN